MKLPSPREAQLQHYGCCPVKDCTEPATVGHHILYEYHPDGPVVIQICKEHHGWITRAQSHAGRRQHFPLTVKQRWFFWFQLKNGEMKRPRETHLDRDWKENGPCYPFRC